MATRKKADAPPTVSNTNNNTNNVNVHVNLDQPKTTSSKKPNWVVKAIVLGIITLALSLTGYFIKKHYDQPGKPAVIGHP